MRMKEINICNWEAEYERSRESISIDIIPVKAESTESDGKNQLRPFKRRQLSIL